LHSIPAQAKAIPYVTSYYENNWGFCISQEERNCLRPGTYRVCIQSELMAGAMSYGELILPGRDETEILLSTYVCHPSMANNELSGPVVTTALARWLMELDRRHTYRIIFIPETIGSILYLSLNLKHLQECVVAGFVMTCIGDTRAYSFLRSRKGSSLADRVAKHVLKYHAPNYIEYSFLDRGSDERQFCSPGVDLPVVSIMRSKYHCYPEYHTSLDDLSLISPSGLLGGFEAMQKCLRILESNYFYRATLLCEPQLGRRGLYPTMSTSTSGVTVRDLKNILAYSDGSLDLIDLAETIGISALDCIPLLNKLALAGLIDHS